MSGHPQDDWTPTIKSSHKYKRRELNYLKYLKIEILTPTYYFYVVLCTN